MYFWNQEKKVNTWIFHPENLASGEKTQAIFRGYFMSTQQDLWADDGFL